jgi:hypothetical protein
MSSQLLTNPLGACEPAGNVIADVRDRRRVRFGFEQVIKGDNAPRFGRWNDQSPADVVQGAAADPPHAILNGMERRQQQVASILGLFKATARCARISYRISCAASPTRRRRPQQRINRLSFLAGRLSANDV